MPGRPIRLIATTTVQAVDQRGVTTAAVTQTLENPIQPFKTSGPTHNDVANTARVLMDRAGDAIIPALTEAVVAQQEATNG